MTDHPPVGLTSISDAQTRHLLASLPRGVLADIDEHYRQGPRSNGILILGTQIGDDAVQWISIDHSEIDRISSSIMFRDVLIAGMETTIRGGLPETTIQGMKGRLLSGIVGHRYAADVVVDGIERVSLSGGEMVLRLTCSDAEAADRPD